MNVEPLGSRLSLNKLYFRRNPINKPKQKLENSTYSSHKTDTIDQKH